MLENACQMHSQASRPRDSRGQSVVHLVDDKQPVESADIILVQNNPLDVVKIFQLSRATYRKMIQNLVWATGYNVVAIPLAAGVLALFGCGFLLSPAIGALFMSLSTVIVAINAQLLRREKLAA